MKSKQTSLVLATLVAGFSASALAADTGFYGYLSAGQSQSDRKGEADRALTGAGATAFTSSMDDTDNAWKIQAGYRFNKNLAIEGGYAKLGELAYRAAITAPVAETGVVTLGIDGWNLDVVGRLPFNDSLTGFAKVGAFVYNLDYQCTGTVYCGTASRSASGTSFHYGLGVDYAFAGNWFARAEYEVFAEVGDPMSADGTTGTSQEDVRLASVGIGYRF
jgi:OOP family OmpA-OmpF porin